jgi:hypothetical protein
LLSKSGEILKIVQKLGMLPNLFEITVKRDAADQEIIVDKLCLAK